MDQIRAFGNDDRRARVLLALAAEPGDIMTGYMVATHGPRGALHIALDTVEHPAVGTRQIDQWSRDLVSRLDVELAADVMDDVEAGAARLLIPEDPDWPSRFDGQLDVAPLAVWAVGDVDLLREDPARPTVALLGSTHPSFPGSMTATRLAADLTSDGYRVLSSGTHGIGGATVDGTVAVDGQPMMVLPGQPTMPRPVRHDEVFEQAAEMDVIVAELALGDGYGEAQHRSRDRVLLPLADAVVLVEAPLGDRELGTVREASRSGIGVGAVPHRPGASSAAGSELLLHEGVAGRIAGAGDVSDLLEHIGEYRPDGHPEVARAVEGLRH